MKSCSVGKLRSEEDLLRGVGFGVVMFGGVAVRGSCGVGELQCGVVAVWGSCGGDDGPSIPNTSQGIDA